MSNLYLLKSSVESVNYDDFVNGFDRLNSIEKQPNHTFFKSSDIYTLPNYEKVFSNFGQIEQVLVQFIESLTPIDSIITSEEEADKYFNCNNNAFLGIDFTHLKISNNKQITCNDDYKRWSFSILNILSQLRSKLIDCDFSASFIREFNRESEDIQQSIIDEFDKAKRRNLVTPFTPDNSVIKDVSPKNHKVKVYELRVYTPVALRVYFNEVGGKVKVASMDKKANPNQNKDIASAHRILRTM